MIAANPTEIRSLALRYGCTFAPPPPPKPPKPKLARIYRRGEGKNLTRAKAWIAKQGTSEFTYADVAKGTGMKPEAAKYVMWRMAFSKQIIAIPRTQFENHQHARRYVANNSKVSDAPDSAAPNRE